VTTTEQAPADRAKQVHARLDELAPYPESAEATTAQNLARWLAVRAAVINHQQLSPGTPMSRSQVELLTILFAASHALYALDASPGNHDLTAREIRYAWDDGAGIGEWLWDHLGTAACTRIGPLADELSALRQKPDTGLLAHADPILSALRLATLEATSANHRDAYAKALVAVEEELEAAS
jgi:hypothetical protein